MRPATRKTKRNRLSERGQISIMLGIMMLTFLFMFCFVVNLGMLVNAKINLQNAADLAAYAGAATEARQLDHISYLNYEMRRQFKKFLFRYYVIGNMAQAGFPSGASGPGSTPVKWTPGPGKEIYGVPVVCLVFNSNDNYCQIDTLPPISIPPLSNFDAINDALNNSLTNLEQIRQNECLKIGTTNLFVLELWLWNGNPNADPDTGFTGDEQQIQSVVQGLVQGLGLVPRELLLRQRIKTLSAYVNEPPQAGVTLEAAQNFSKAPDPAVYERTIQAFNSAFYTLGNNTFTSANIQMDEIQNPSQLALEDVTTNFDTYAIYYELVPDKSSSASTGNATIPSNCFPAVIPQTLKGDFSVGVYKDPTVLTYYAIRLTAKATLMFNPWGVGGLTLTAYSAAQPFGSRIGPDNTIATWSSTASPSAQLPINQTEVGVGFTPVGQIPNLPVQQEDTTDWGKGWDTTQVLGTLLSTAFPSAAMATQAGGSAITSGDLARAYEIAMAPNPWEPKYYNIPNNLEEGIVSPSASFIPSIFDSTGTLAFWAPLVSPGTSEDFDTELQSDLQDLFQGAGPGAAAVESTLKNQISTYVNSIKTTPGEDGETFNVAHITDPFHFQPITAAGSSTGLVPLPTWMMPVDPTLVLTSWNAPNDPGPLGSKSTGPGSPGRMGYSVKFVSFDSLINNKIKTTNSGATEPNNPPQGDDNAKADMSFLQH